MQVDTLYQKLKALESQKAIIEAEIKTIRQQISTHSVLSKEEKIALFKSLFVGRNT